MVPTSELGREARRVTRERPRPREEPVIRYVAMGVTSIEIGIGIGGIEEGEVRLDVVVMLTNVYIGS